MGDWTTTLQAKGCKLLKTLTALNDQKVARHFTFKHRPAWEISWETSLSTSHMLFKLRKLHFKSCLYTPIITCPGYFGAKQTNSPSKATWQLCDSLRVRARMFPNCCFLTLVCSTSSAASAPVLRANARRSSFLEKKFQWFISLSSPWQSLPSDESDTIVSVYLSLLVGMCESEVTVHKQNAICLDFHKGLLPAEVCLQGDCFERIPLHLFV